MATIPDKPNTRTEQYLNRLVTNSGDIPEKPVTNIEQYLAALVEGGGGGGGGDGIPKSATFWGANYDETNNKVGGDLVFYADGSTGRKVSVGEFTSQNTHKLALDGKDEVFVRVAGQTRLKISNSGIDVGANIDMKNSYSTPKRILNLGIPSEGGEAANKSYVDQIAVNYSTVSGNAAPTAATAAQYVGQLYYDTANDDMYYCSAITAQGTTPETYSYTWNTIGGGGGGLDPATTFWGQTAGNGVVNGDMDYSDGTHTASIVKKIGTTGTRATLAFGYSGPVQLGNSTSSNIDISETGGNGRIKLLAPHSSILVRGSSFDFYAQTKITNVKDPTSAQDAATKNYVDTAISSVSTATITNEDWSTLWQ